MSLLGAVRPSATTETVLYTVPNGKKAIVNVTMMNASGTVAANIRLGVQATNGSMVAKDYIYYDHPLQNDEREQFTGIALSAGNTIRVYTDVATVNFHCNGLEEPI